MVRKFIQKAIKHPGELKRYAEKEGCIGLDGKIKDSCVKDHLNKLSPSARKTHLQRAYRFYHQVLAPAGVARMEKTQMFREGTTKHGFHCMNCGKPLPDREIVCKRCHKEFRKRGMDFEMTRLPTASERMEHL